MNKSETLANIEKSYSFIEEIILLFLETCDLISRYIDLFLYSSVDCIERDGIQKLSASWENFAKRIRESVEGQTILAEIKLNFKRIDSMLSKFNEIPKGTLIVGSEKGSPLGKTVEGANIEVYYLARELNYLKKERIDKTLLDSDTDDNIFELYNSLMEKAHNLNELIKDKNTDPVQIRAGRLWELFFQNGNINLNTIRMGEELVKRNKPFK